MSTNNKSLTFEGKPITLLGKEISIGDIAPDFTVIDSNLAPVKLSDAKGKAVIISVVVSVETSVCADQTRRFNLEAASHDNLVIYTISADSPSILEKFCASSGIDAVKTLSDQENFDFGMKYGFVIEGMKLLTRGIVVVNAEGIVTHIEYVDEVTSHPDYDKALNAAIA